jgi:hypothetical protein
MRYLLGTLLLAVQIAAATTVVVPPATVQQLVTPFLDLRAQAELAKGEQRQVAIQQSEKLLAQLFRRKTRASDEALVILMNFYVGESLGPDLVHQVTLRGKRMLPLLLKYQAPSVSFPDKKYPTSLLLADDVKQTNFDNAIKSIRAGKVFGEE